MVVLAGMQRVQKGQTGPESCADAHAPCQPWHLTWAYGPVTPFKDKKQRFLLQPGCSIGQEQY